MQTSLLFDAIVEIAERRNALITERDEYAAAGLTLNYHSACGEIAGLQKALDLLEAAGQPVASAAYIATVPSAARVA